MDAGGWPPSPPCSSSVRPFGPPPHTASVVLSVKPSVNTRLLPSQQTRARSTFHVVPWIPSTPQLGPPLPALSRNTRPPSPPPAGPSFGLFPSQECPLHQAKPALLRSSQGSAPPSFVLSQNEFIPRVLRFPAHLRRAGRWGRKTLCARHQGGFHLWAKSASHPGWALGGLEYPPSPPNAHLPRCQAPGRQDFG